MTPKTLNPLNLMFCCLVLSACSESSGPTSQPVSETPAQPVAESTESIEPNADAQADGIEAPLSFTLTDLDGKAVRAEDFRGKWLVLNYWATWCAPCRDEIPELVAFQNNHDDVQVLGIAYEDAEVAKLKNFAADFSVNYPLLTIDVYNPPGFAEEGGLGLPTTIVYDPQGMRHDKHMGPIDEAGLIELVSH